MSTDSSPKASSRAVFGLTSAVIGIVLIVILSCAGAAYAYERSYADRMLPGIQVLGVPVDGLSKEDAQKKVNSAIDAALSKGITFIFRGKQVTISNVSGADNPDTAHEVVRYVVDDAVEKAFLYGHETQSAQRLVSAARLRLSSVSVNPDVQVDHDAVLSELQAALAKDVHPATNASLSVDTHADPPIVHITPEQDGVELVMDSVFDTLSHQAAALAFSPIVLGERAVHPTVTSKDLASLDAKIKDVLSRPALTFTSGTDRFPITSSTLAGWISVTSSASGDEVILDPVAFGKDLKTIGASLEKEGKNGGLVSKDGKIVSFSPGSDGIQIDTDAIYQDVVVHWPASSTFPMITRTAPAKLVGEDPEKLGITDLLGVGHSNFSGSPVNRRKNIAHGIELVNGSLIQPGETFSLIKTLGAIDGEHNWLPELVIKGNETKPEFGGGLCQIGTTTFRGALAAGLPIVERANHSYRVRYYEPAGTDATIYDPKPDFRFMNDTANPVFINAYEKGDDVYFEFWGKKDGRVAVQTTPVVSNVVQPPPTKLVESLDLPVGKKKCTETAHAGADAKFDYSVTYASGEVKSETFHSHYKPWQAVCLIGVSKLSSSSTSDGLSSPDATP